MCFAARRVTAFNLVDWVRAKAFDLTSRSTVKTLSPLQDLVNLHLVGYFYIFKIRQLERPVLVQVGAHLGRRFEPLFD